jgi:hypothetical protein
MSVASSAAAASGVPKIGPPPMVPGASRSALIVSLAGTVVSTDSSAPVPPGLRPAAEMHCAEQPTFD